MKNKGFTLVELLGVILIISLLTILVIPSITNSVKNSSKDTDELTLEMIYDAADMYISNNTNNFIKKNGSKKIIELDKLVDAGLLVSPIKLSNNDDITNDKCIQVTYNNGYNYELKDSGTCEINFQNGEVVYFDVTEGKICDNYTISQSNTGVKEGCMKFYAFNDSEENDNVNLLLDHNTTAKVAWYNISLADGDNYVNKNGPFILLDTLKNDTSSWQGVEKLDNYTMDQISQTSGANYTILYKDENYKARLITAQEIAQITGNTTWSETTANVGFYLDTNTTTESLTCTNINTTGCNYTWLYEKTYNCFGCKNIETTSIYGYWTASSVGYYVDRAWYMSYWAALNNEDISLENGAGVRPVIEVSKTKFY